jgi:hypothetical protein
LSYLLDSLTSFSTFFDLEQTIPQHIATIPDLSRPFNLRDSRDRDDSAGWFLQKISIASPKVPVGRLPRRSFRQMSRKVFVNVNMTPIKSWNRSIQNMLVILNVGTRAGSYACLNCPNTLGLLHCESELSGHVRRGNLDSGLQMAGVASVEAKITGGSASPIRMASCHVVNSGFGLFSCCVFCFVYPYSVCSILDLFVFMLRILVLFLISLSVSMLSVLVSFVLILFVFLRCIIILVVLFCLFE